VEKERRSSIDRNNKVAKVESKRLERDDRNGWRYWIR
jgi:hypothetical protein